MINVSVKVKDNETVERALKRFKKKCEKAHIKHETRDRKYYTKPTTKKNEMMKKAKYKQKMYAENNY